MTREVAKGHGPIKLKVMADYGCFTYWDDECPTGPIDPAPLPLTPGLAEDVQRWVDLLESMLNWDVPPENRPQPASSATRKDLDERPTQ